MPDAASPMLETRLVPLPEKIVSAKDLVEVPISFAQPAKILEVQHSPSVTLLSVRVSDKSFPERAIEGEIVPAGVPVIFAFGNASEDARTVRASLYVEMASGAVAQPAQPHAALAEIMGVPVVPPGGAPPLPTSPVGAHPAPTASPPAWQAPPAASAWQPPQAADPNAPPPPGQSKSFALGNQQVTVTTPAAPPPFMVGGMQIPTAGFPQVPPPPGGVSSFQQGNQQIMVTSPGAPRGAHPATQAISPVVQPRVHSGPETVTVGTDEVAILLKRGDAENLLKLIRGAVLFPAFVGPIDGAVARALGHQP
jgi:hypothetical protein